MGRPIVAIVALLGLLLLGTGFEWPGRVARLQRELATAGPARRREVVRMLSHYGAAEVQEALLTALSDPNREVRAEAANAAGRVRLMPAARLIVEWLDDEDVNVRIAAARALGRIRDERTVPPLVRALGDAETGVRQAAVAALAAIGGTDVVVPVTARLDDRSSDVRTLAARALGQLGDQRSVVPLIGRVRDDAPDVRMAVYGALAELGDQRAHAALVQGLSDSTSDVRLAAIAAMGRLGLSDSVGPLLATLEQRDARQAAAAVAALGAIGDRRGLEAVIVALARNDTRQVATQVLMDRARAQRGLEREPEADVTRMLVHALRTTGSQVHVTAISQVLWSIGWVRDPSAAAAALLRALPQAPRAQPNPILHALAATGAPEALVPLLERLSDGTDTSTITALELYFARREPDGRAADPLIAALGTVQQADRVRVVRLLGRIRAARALSVLRPLLTHDDADLRRTAVAAIGAIGDPRGGTALLPLMDDRDPRTRFEAARALGRVADAEMVGVLVSHVTRREPADRQALVLCLGGALGRLRNENALPEEVSAAALAALQAAATGPDEHLAARAIDALGRDGGEPAVALLVNMLAGPTPERRVAAAASLAFARAPAALAALRPLMEARELGLRMAAITAVGESGTREDGPPLLEIARSATWPTTAAATFALARMARRELLDEAAIPALCALGGSRDPYVRANVASALGVLRAAPCPDGPDPVRWLERSHAAPVRAAAARWLSACAAAGHLPARQTEALLAACARTDLAANVAHACRVPALPPLTNEADVYAYAIDGQRLLRRELVGLRLADGTVLLTHTDRNGHLRLAHAPEGAILLDDPMATPLEP